MNVRMLLRSILCAGVIAASFAALPAVAGANLVQNGSFENGYPGDNICGAWWFAVGYDCYYDTSTVIPGWTETAGGVDWTSSTYFGNPVPPGEPVAQDGNYFIDLVGAGSPGKIEQAVPTTAGGLYTLSFYYTTHSQYFCSLGSASATAMAGSAALVVAAPTGAPYSSASLPFTGTGSTTTISFAANEPKPCGGILIDNVSVEAALPTSADQCRDNGWQTFGVFNNQGDCVSFVATGGKNEPGQNQP
jgi:hypothetical protein